MQCANVEGEVFKRIAHYFYSVTFAYCVLFLSHAWAQVDVPDDYTSIQAAIDAISNDSSLSKLIVIEPGTYTETLTITTSGITLQGEETARTIIEPIFEAQPIISLSNLSGVTIRNLTFTVGNQGIEANNVSGVLITNNVFALDSDATALTFDDSSDAQVEHNVFYENSIAIERENELVSIRNNIFVDNALAISGAGDQVEYNCFYSNDARGETGDFFVIDENPLFASPSDLDFHLRQDSPCINEGEGVDAVDDTVADIGAYGGAHADIIPFPVQDVTATDISDTEATPTIDVDWSANLHYLITHDDEPGGYLLYYDSDEPGSPYDGIDAGSGTLSSPIDVGNVTSYQLAGLSVDSGIPGVPTITRVEPENERVTLQWSEVSTATGYRIHYGVSSVSEQTEDVGDVNRFTIDSLINETEYVFAVSAYAQAQYYIALKAYDSTDDANESAYSDEQVVDMGDERTSANSTTVTAIPELVIPVPNLPDEGCFIATAAFGHEDVIQVQWLREFRDQHLKRFVLGRLFIDVYYTLSPSVADVIRSSEPLKQLVRVMLLPIVTLTKLLLTWPLTTFIFLGLSAWFIGRRWRAPQAKGAA